MKTVRGRFAPSPTGALHLGNARTALIAWLQVRALGGELIMRMEDLDRPRSVAGAAESILEDLRWLGIDWDEGPDVGGPYGPYAQSARQGLYEEALARLEAQGGIFPCWCSRAQVARAASAPHGPSDDGPRYPGTCRALPREVSCARMQKERPALRFRVEPGATELTDGLHGQVAIDVSATVGDFVIRRSDGVYAYQLAVAVDDARMGITHVLRGDDLLSSTPRQILLLRALQASIPQYAHVPLLVGADGKRMCKRNGDATLSALRQHGIAPQRVVAALARSCGLSDKAEIEARDLLPGFDLARVSREPGRVDLDALHRTL